MLNAFAESKNGVLRAVKRPSLVAAFAALEAGAGNGQGLFAFSIPNNTPGGSTTTETLVGIQNDVLNNSPAYIATKLKFTVQPSAVALNTSISPSVKVSILKQNGGVFSSTANVTIALSNNPTGATLSGTLTVAAVAGVATFSDLKLDRSGSDFTLIATSSGLKSATSNAFTIATSLVFTTQPVSTSAGATLDPIVVTVRDSAGATDTNYTGDITLALYTGAGSGVLSGLTTRGASSGVATFSGLSIADAATYSVRATGGDDTHAYTPAAGVSNSFSIVTPYVMIAAALDGTTSGYNSNAAIGFPTGGSITPSTYNGVSIVALYASSTGNVSILMSGNRAQSFFTSAQVVGATALMPSASASIYTYDAGLNVTFWVFIGYGTIPAGTRSVVII